MLMSVGQRLEVRMDKCFSPCRIRNQLVGCEINSLGHYYIFKDRKEGKMEGDKVERREG